jgi:hypothetical protein
VDEYLLRGVDDDARARGVAHLHGLTVGDECQGVGDGVDVVALRYSQYRTRGKESMKEGGRRR